MSSLWPDFLVIPCKSIIWQILFQNCLFIHFYSHIDAIKQWSHLWMVLEGGVMMICKLFHYPDPSTLVRLRLDRKPKSDFFFSTNWCFDQSDHWIQNWAAYLNAACVPEAVSRLDSSCRFSILIMEFQTRHASTPKLKCVYHVRIPFSRAIFNCQYAFYKRWNRNNLITTAIRRCCVTYCS